jgi:hypothetical protein
MGAIRPTPNDKMNPEQIRMTVRYVAAVGNNAVTFRKYSLRILAGSDYTSDMIKFSRAISRVKRLSGEKTNVSKTMTRTKMVFETVVFSLLNHLTRLIAREYFIILSRRESNKSHYTSDVSRFSPARHINPDYACMILTV